MAKTKDDDTPDHDGAYRTLFAQPVIVQQFLEAFAPEEVVKTLEFDEMTPMGTQFLTEALARRTTDCIWRIPTTDDNPLYLCLILEFQSSVDIYMAVRVATYISLLYEHLIDTERAKLAQTLPPVLPIVLYNGNKVWSANTALANFYPVHSDSLLEGLQLQSRYLLVDVGHLLKEHFPDEPNIASTLFEMEQASNARRYAQLTTLYDRLIALADTHHDSALAIKKAFLIFFNGILGRRGATLTPDTINDLMEVRTMLQDLGQLAQRRYEKGVKKGIEKGIEKGLGALRRTAMFVLVSRFGVDEEQWQSRLAPLDTEQLEDFIKRALHASSEADLLP